MHADADGVLRALHRRGRNRPRTTVAVHDLAFIRSGILVEVVLKFAEQNTPDATTANNPLSVDDALSLLPVLARHGQAAINCCDIFGDGLSVEPSLKLIIPYICHFAQQF